MVYKIFKVEYQQKWVEIQNLNILNIMFSVDGFNFEGFCKDI